jgi:hypothetical protein
MLINKHDLQNIIKESLHEHLIFENELGEDTSVLEDGTPVCEACLYETVTCGCPDVLEEADYQGRKVQLGKPFLTPGGPKKRAVYVRNKKGNVVKVNFGDKKMKIKKSNPKRRKSFRARHKCSQKKDRTSAGYWSCKFWE